jgi:WhiB family transcriptional regulator, redox-sensing transcriptional regulator
MSSVERIDEEHWRFRAACQGERGVLFYPPMRPEKKATRTAREQRAKQVCATCEVRAECLDQALRNGERYGVWGGLTDVERRRLNLA